MPQAPGGVNLRQECVIRVLTWIVIAMVFDAWHRRRKIWEREDTAERDDEQDQDAEPPPALS